MNMHGKTRPASAMERLACWCHGILLGGLLVTWGEGFPLLAETTVKTLGGGRLMANGSDAGFTDGDALQVSQFHSPYGCAVDTTGRLYVADRDNGALRQLDLNGNRSRTILTSLAQPVAVAVDATNVIYVLTQGDGSILRLNRGVGKVLTSQLLSPTAMAYDGASSLFVAQNNGSVVKVSIADGTVSVPLIGGLNQPGGIAVLDSGLLAVSETGANRIGVWDPSDGSLRFQIGSGVAGFADGWPEGARFRQPHQIAKAPGGSLVVADRGNHRVRLVDFDGFVTTLYGVDPSLWEGPACTSCSPMILPGWLDGSAEFAEARDPVGVAVSSAGRIYTTELFYHLVRVVDDATFTAPDIEVAPPVIAPKSGYYPMGQTITVTDPNPSGLLPAVVYYTTDGTQPTTNSFRVAMTNGVGTIFWRERRRDLTFLWLRTFLGNKVSEVVSGESVSAAEIGLPQDMAAGIGSSAIVPIVVNLRTNQEVRSLQFRVEVTPETPTAAMIPETFDALSISTNDFVPVVTAAQGKTGAVFFASGYAVESSRTRGMVIACIGTNWNLQMTRYAVVGMLTVPIPPTAQRDDRYSVRVVNPSGTTDGAQERLEITPMPARSIIVTDVPYLVGDTSVAAWYNAGQFDSSGALRRGFGDGLVDNSDVNNAFAAALGNCVPFPHTDLFDALDAFPEDTADTPGGDGLIRFLDWQIILMRSLGLDLSRWERCWGVGGVRTTTAPGHSSSSDTPGQTLTAPLPGAVWAPQVTLSAERVTQAYPGLAIDVPITVRVASGYQLAGLAFRAIVQPVGTAPPLDQPLQFRASPNIAAPAQSLAPSVDTILCGWPLVPSSSFDPPLTGTNLLGYLRVVIPFTAGAGQTYTVRFTNADGSPDLQTQYDFETRPNFVWVLSDAVRPSDSISDEWRLHFFGSVTSEAAGAEMDPDHDGVSNQAEYLAGTDPTKAQSYLRLEGTTLDPVSKRVVLRWLSAPGRSYAIQAASTLSGSDWVTLAASLLGDGRWQEWTSTQITSETQFYRIRLQP
jgi:hypothetical protein